MKSTEKISFSKFFPITQSYVVVQGKAKAPDDFFLQLDIGDGIDKTSFYVSDHNSKQALEMLKAMRSAVQESLEFFEKAMQLPAMPEMKTLGSEWDKFFTSASTMIPAKKPEAKKPAAKKKTPAKK